MRFDSTAIQLKDGTAAVLRSPEKEDAAELLAYLKDCAGETEFILRTPEECESITLSIEENFITSVYASPLEVMMTCFVGDTAAGNCQLSYNRGSKIAHRASVAIGVREKFWNLGIGTAMFRAMIAHAKAQGVEQLELEYIDGNDRARHLYDKMGFAEVARHPNAFHLKDGTSRSAVYMVKKL